MAPPILPGIRSPILLRPRVTVRSGLGYDRLQTGPGSQEISSIGTTTDPIFVQGDVNDEAHDPSSLLDTNSEEDEDLQVLEGLGYDLCSGLQVSTGEEVAS
jgi:hypothetical protein